MSKVICPESGSQLTVGSTTASMNVTLTTGESVDQKIARLERELATASAQTDSLRKALEAIKNAPGGGPSRRIAVMTLDKEQGK